MKLRLLFVVIALMGLSTAWAQQLTIPSEASREEMGRWVKHYWDRVEHFREENAEIAEASPEIKWVVLLGSSSIEHMELRNRHETFLPGLNVINRGISADGIGIGGRGILQRLDDSVFDCNPSHVFILNGRNNLGGTFRRGTPTVEEVLACYREVVDTIRERAPEVKVTIITCPPVNLNYEGMTPFIVEYNVGLRQIAEETGCGVIDFHPMVVGTDGLLPLEMTHDGLHFNDIGYTILGEEIVKAVQAP